MDRSTTRTSLLRVALVLLLLLAWWCGWLGRRLLREERGKHAAVGTLLVLLLAALIPPYTGYGMVWRAIVLGASLLAVWLWARNERTPGSVATSLPR